MNSILITGAGRGLGLALVRSYVRRGDRVFAAVRDPSRTTELKELQASDPDRVVTVVMDVQDSDSIRAACRQVRMDTSHLDVLVNNAGVYSTRGSAVPDEVLGGLTQDGALMLLRTNAVGPLLVAQECLGLLRESNHAKVVTVSSYLGSVASNTAHFPYYYSASKAAANMYMRSFASDPETAGVVSVLLDPGDMRTGMTHGDNGESDPEQIAEAVVSLVGGLTPEDHNRFLRWDGSTLAW